MSGNRSRIARRETRGHDSTASHVQLEGQKRLSPHQLVRLERISAGKCPNCGGDVPEEVRLGKVFVRGTRVNKCDECLKLFKDYKMRRRQAALDETMATTTLMGERIKAATEIGAARERFTSQPDSKILVVGVRSTNIQREARQHPRLITWESTGRHAKSGITTVPQDVRVIICSRFCSHQMSQALQRTAKERNAFMFHGLLATGEMRKHLAELLNLDHEKSHDGASDESPDDTPAPPLALPRSLFHAPLKSAPVSFQSASEKPMLKTETATPAQSPEAVLDDAVDMLGNGIAALQLAREALLKAKDALRTGAAANAEDAQKLKALREMLKGL